VNLLIGEARAPSDLRRVYVGTAGWSLSLALAPRAHPGQGGLSRYAAYFNAVEVNSTFYRLPRAQTIERWRDGTPPGFRFTVKVPRSITHEARLVDVEQDIAELGERVARFERKLGALLIQLPASFEFDAGLVDRFISLLAGRTTAPLVFEPRHPSWFAEDATRLLVERDVARAAADPACCPAAALPLPASRVVYFRWHGSPRMYFSAYLPEALAELGASVLAARQSGGVRRDAYCFLDNTALGAAAVNALSLKAELLSAKPTRATTRRP
jgi:uncharacterized protein YecE (DUF72 family)